MAIDYPWCAQGGGIGGSPQCSNGTFQQCQAAISGLGGTCVQNPAASYSQNTAPQPSPEGPSRPRRKGNVYHSPGKHGWYYE
jgi:hypothetical protein